MQAASQLGAIAQQPAYGMPSGQSTSIIKEREIIREIVKVPCKYCNQLIDHTLKNCPYCNAPL
jgi:hypothetical protein